MKPSSLLKFQIGPVQEFIAQARSTRDLWSGSYLLSWLMAAGIARLLKEGGTPIFPAADDQPLVAFHLGNQAPGDQKALLTPNLPNLFVARVPVEPLERAKAIAMSVVDAIKAEWVAIASSVWDEHSELGIGAEHEARFNAQVNRFLSISWQITPETGADSYAEDYGNNGWHLDAVRQTREFAAWGAGQIRVGGDKDSLNGRDEAVAGGKDALARVETRFKHLFKHDDHLGAVTLIKRVWHLTFLAGKRGLKTGLGEFKIRSTRAIAARDSRDDDDENTETSHGDKYLAAIAFDGDSIGAWVSGDKLTDKSELREHHSNFSHCLSKFALDRARKIIEGDEPAPKDGHFKGFLVYAGGDDVVALVPAEDAIGIAQELRNAFCEETTSIGQNEHPDASAGIAIAHFKSPLQDLIREAQSAEKRAKNIVGRPAFSVTLMKRSGEIAHWGCKWDSGGVELHDAIATALRNGDLSAKFPHRVCALLEPYLTQRTGLGQMEDAADFNAEEVIGREFAHAISRQSPHDKASDNAATLGPMLDSYLARMAATAHDPQTLLTAVIGLCTTVAFADRNRAEPSLAEKQPLSP